MLNRNLVKFIAIILNSQNYVPSSRTSMRVEIIIGFQNSMLWYRKNDVILQGLKVKYLFKKCK